MKRSLSSYSLILFVLLLSLLATPLTASSAGFQKQAKTPQENAAATLQTMSPEEKIGQLFLITFTGSQAGPDSQIYDLINNHYVGGAVLLAENDNFTSGKSSLEQIQALNRQLQSSRWAAATETRTDPATNATFTPAFIPLFIGIPEEGDGYPYDQILHGVTPLPNQMALGATWNPDLVLEIGKLLGQELHGLGFNLLLGPSLDVLEAPYLESKNNLGTRAFGGDPFWVGELGQAYVEGIHLGSEGKLAVSATHFPGHGGSDRPPEEEVATVRKSLEELKSFELAPFFSVTGDAPTITSTVDALLVSHIRYQGFQGNIRATTRPISFDPQAFSLLLGLPPIASWRDQGGVLISDNLGSKAVRRFYTLTNQTFDARRVALNAFLAGNDLLYMADFTSDDAPEQYAATLRTLEFFTQKYREDTAFAKRVDEAVLRILTLKYKLYGDFTLNKTLPTADSLPSIGQGDQFVFDVAREFGNLDQPVTAGPGNLDPRSAQPE